MTYFAVLTGVATIFCIVLQFSGKFPAYRSYLSHASAMLLGLTAGLVVNLGASPAIRLPGTITARELLGLLLFSGTGLLAFVLMLATVIPEDKERRVAAAKSASAVSGFLLFLLIFFLADFFPRLPD